MAKVLDRAASPSAVEDPPSKGSAASEPDKSSGIPLPIPAARELSIDQLIAYWKSIPDFQLPRILGYLYRHDPRIILPKGQHYIHKYASPVESADQIIRQWGAGEYGLKLSDAAKALGRGEVCRARFKSRENYAEIPPVLDYETLDMDHKDNRAFIEWARTNGRLPKLQSQQQPGNPTNDAAVQGLVSTLNTVLPRLLEKKSDNSTDASFSKIIEMFATANKTSLDMALSQVKQNSPKETIELITALQAAFHQPAPSNSSEKLLELFLKMQGESQAALAAANNRNIELLLKVVESKRDEHGGGMKNFREMLETMAAMREMFGGDDGGGKWGWLRPFVPQALGVVDRLASAIPFIAGRRNAQQQPGPPGAPPSHPMPPASPPVIAPSSAAPDGMPNGVPGVGSVPPQGGDGGDPMMSAMFNGLIQQIWLPLIKHLNEGARGEEFFDFVAVGWGLGVSEHAQLKAIGLERIVSMVKVQPQAWQMVASIESEFRVFIQQLLNWSPDWEQSQEVDPPGAALIPVDFNNRD